MQISDLFLMALSLIGGLCLFMFGMNLMGEGLEKRAGNSLRSLVGNLTNNKFMGFLTGLGVTAIIQSSSATTVMVVGFVNSKIMTLRQAVNVIIGANLGTTVTSWILSLAGIGGSAGAETPLYIELLKPTSFSPVLALIGIVLYMFCKGQKKKDTGLILLGFATLMFGMDAMSGAVEGLKDWEAFQNLFIAFENPILGMLAGLILTVIIQSSSASVGILQALAGNGLVTYGAAVPIILGQNVGTCVTAVISCAGTSKNAKRAAMVHLIYNLITLTIWFSVFLTVKAIASQYADSAIMRLLTSNADYVGIATIHTVYNILSVAVMLPFSFVLEKLACLVIRDRDEDTDNTPVLDERLMLTPVVAIQQSRATAIKMADISIDSMKNALRAVTDYTPELADLIRKQEADSDKYEDIIGSYLVKLSATKNAESVSSESSELLHAIGDFERISDHALNILESAEELRDKKLSFSDDAVTEFSRLTGAIHEILDLSLESFKNNDVEASYKVQSLEEVVDELKEQMRTRHIMRLQEGKCGIETGFVWSDLLTDLERTSDHCANIAGSVIAMHDGNSNIHKSLRDIRKNDETFKINFDMYMDKYKLGTN